LSAEFLVWHFDPQSMSAVQATVGSFAHVPKPVAGSIVHVEIGTRQVMNPGFPQVDLAAQLTTLPLQFCGTTPECTSVLI
jgi:hypothetical protein